MSAVPFPQTLSVYEIRDLLPSQRFFLVDVRQPWEWDLCHLEGAVNIPLDQLSSRLTELPENIPLITICHHGVRSLKAAVLLKSAGFSSVTSMVGGIDAWAKEIDTSIGIY